MDRFAFNVDPSVFHVWLIADWKIEFKCIRPYLKQRLPIVLVLQPLGAALLARRGEAGLGETGEGGLKFLLEGPFVL